MALTQLLLFVITYIQGVHNYTPEANHEPRVYNIAHIPWLQYMVHVMLFSIIKVLYFLCFYYVATFTQTISLGLLHLLCR
jgi:hypothetical protein